MRNFCRVGYVGPTPRSRQGSRDSTRMCILGRSTPAPATPVRCLTVLIKGTIVPGDGAKFVQVLRQSHPSLFHVLLWSSGGSVEEAMKLGRLIRKNLITTEAPSDLADYRKGGAGSSPRVLCPGAPSGTESTSALSGSRPNRSHVCHKASIASRLPLYFNWTRSERGIWSRTFSLVGSGTLRCYSGLIGQTPFGSFVAKRWASPCVHPLSADDLH
jgi:hypothetical protein